MKLEIENKYLIATGILALLAGWFFLVKKSNPVTIDPNLDYDLVLAPGSKGPEVEELQRLLYEKYNAYIGETGVKGDGIDGIFGAKTADALHMVKGVESTTLNVFLNS